jgi:hypothetical protein
MQENEQVVPQDYGYTQGQQIMIDGYTTLQLMDFLGRIIRENPPTMFAPMQYAETTQIQKNDKGEVSFVETDWKDYNMDAFFASMASPKGGVMGIADIPFRALQFQRYLELNHLENIRIGAAKKLTDIEEQNALDKLS